VSKKRIPDIIDSNFQKDCQILKMLGTNIPGTPGNHMTVQVPITGGEGKRKRLLCVPVCLFSFFSALMLFIC